MQDDSRKTLWTERVGQWRASGLSQRAFCEQHGWPLNRLVYWARRLKEVSGPVRLVAVKLSDKEAENEVNAPLTLRGAGGWQLMLPAQPDVAWLADLLRRLP